MKLNHALSLWFLLAALQVHVAAGEPPQSPLVAHSFPIYWTTPGASSQVPEQHRGVLVFGQVGATCDLFPGGMSIPYTGTLSTKRSGRRGSTISAFNATGETVLGAGTIAFTAAKDGAGAKGEVTVTSSGHDPVRITFTGTKP